MQAQKGGVSPGKIEEEWYLVFGAELPVIDGELNAYDMEVQI